MGKFGMSRVVTIGLAAVAGAALVGYLMKSAKTAPAGSTPLAKTLGLV